MFYTSSHGALHLDEVWKHTTNGFRVMERTRVHGRNGYVQCSKGNKITPKVGKSELLFICSANRLIVLYICVKFRENISNGIRVMERTPNHEELTDGRTPKISDGIT